MTTRAHLRNIVHLAAAVLAATVTVAPSPASAASPQTLGAFGDWNAFTFDENGKKACYMASNPKKKEPASAKRGEIYFLITHRPAEKSDNVVSVVAGYTYKPSSEVALQVGGKKFSLFTDNDTAWARDDATDKAIVAALKGGSDMVVKGTSNKGTATTDTYSLNGAAAALKAIGTACGVKG